MRCRILHESRGRIRIHFMQRRMTCEQADLLQAYLESDSGVIRARTDERTGWCPGHWVQQHSHTC